MIYKALLRTLCKCERRMSVKDAESEYILVLFDAGGFREFKKKDIISESEGVVEFLFEEIPSGHGNWDAGVAL